MARKKIAYSARPASELFVSVYCTGHATDGGPSHQTEPWRIATFVPDPDLPPWTDGTPRWSETVGTYTTADRAVLTFDTAGTTDRLAGDALVTRADFRADPLALDRGNSRSRSRLDCRTCGLSLRVKAENRDPALWRLAAAGVSEISLVDLSRYSS